MRGILQLLFLPLILILTPSGILTGVKVVRGDQPFWILWPGKEWEALLHCNLQSPEEQVYWCCGPSAQSPPPQRCPAQGLQCSTLHTGCHTVPAPAREGRPGCWHCPSATCHEGRTHQVWDGGGGAWIGETWIENGEGSRRLEDGEKMSQHSSSKQCCLRALKEHYLLLVLYFCNGVECSYEMQSYNLWLC